MAGTCFQPHVRYFGAELPKQGLVEVHQGEMAGMLKKVFKTPAWRSAVHLRQAARPFSACGAPLKHVKTMSSLRAEEIQTILVEPSSETGGMHNQPYLRSMSVLCPLQAGAKEIKECPKQYAVSARVQSPMKLLAPQHDVTFSHRQAWRMKPCSWFFPSPLFGLVCPLRYVRTLKHTPHACLAEPEATQHIFPCPGRYDAAWWACNILPS
jgi:hypothetical protein